MVTTSQSQSIQIPGTLPEDIVHWPGAYAEVPPGDRLRQGDILDRVCFLRLNANPTISMPEAKKLIIDDPLYDFLPAIILNHDCDSQRDRFLQVIAINDVASPGLEEIYPLKGGNSEKKRERFNRYCQNLRQLLKGQIHKYWLPPGPGGRPFEKYMYADLNSLSSLDFSSQRTWAENHRIGRLSKEMMSDLLSFINYRYSRVGRNDYFWLGPLDALAKYAIELVDQIAEHENRVKESKANGEAGFVQDQENELMRLKSEQKMLHNQLIKNIRVADLKNYYHLFIDNHPDLDNPEFKITYLTPITNIWQKVAPGEQPPWQGQMAEMLPS